jgi:hypothetical protein
LGLLQGLVEFVDDRFDRTAERLDELGNSGDRLFELATFFLLLLEDGLLLGPPSVEHFFLGGLA